MVEFISYFCQMKDKRYQIMFERFYALNTNELLNILENVNIICFDTFNYNDGKYCPLAVAKKFHETVENPSDDLMKKMLGCFFDPVNILKGVDGDFYRDNRKDDLVKVVANVLRKKLSENVTF